MSQLRRSKPLRPEQPPLTPASLTSQPATDYAREIAWIKQLLASERRRHGEAETVLTRYIASLERQVEDLRKLYFSTLEIKTSPKGQQ